MLCHDVVVCDDCKRKWQSAIQGIKKICCMACYDKMLLARDPRPNFDPDAPVVVEYQFVNAPRAQSFQASIKRKTPPTPDPVADLALQTSKTLLELSFMPWPDIVPDTLAKRYPHARDGIIWLDETNNRHLYHVKYDAEFETENNMSTSSIAKHYERPYDKFEAVEKMLEGKQWGPHHPKWGKYFDRDPETLAKNVVKCLQEWKQNNINAIQLGKFVHFLIECHCNGKLDLFMHPVFARYTHIRQYLEWRQMFFDPHFIEYRTEFRFASDKLHRRVGTCDLIAVRKNHLPPDQCNNTLTVSMFDWKNALLKRNGFKTREMPHPERMLGTCSELDDCNVAHYTIQQNDYEYMATTYYADWVFKGHTYKKITFEQKQLIGFHEENAKNIADIVPLKDVQHIIAALWAERRESVARWETENRPKIVTQPLRVFSNEESLDILRNLIHKCDACNK